MTHIVPASPVLIILYDGNVFKVRIVEQHFIVHIFVLFLVFLRCDDFLKGSAFILFRYYFGSDPGL